MTFISVVRDFALYDKLVRGNPNNAGGAFVVFDNNAENKTIPARYNSFIDSYDYSKPDWFVFCHEDFQFLEPLASKLDLMREDEIYGVFGAKLRVPGVGLQIDSNKDGTDMSFRGLPVKAPTSVDTVDCACLVVHSSLVSAHSLRFDDNLTYDLYTEDFGIRAREEFGVDTKVLPIRSHHYSYGSIQPRFFRQLEYLNEKYADASRVYVTSTGHAIGRRDMLDEAVRLINSKSRIPYRRLFYRKISHAGRETIKVMGVTVWSREKHSFAEWHESVRGRGHSPA